MPSGDDPTAPAPELDSHWQSLDSKVLQWLSSLPKRRNVMEHEIDAWITDNTNDLPQQIMALPRQTIYGRIISMHKRIRMPDQPSEQEPPPPQGLEVVSHEPKAYQFQRSDLWRPIYSWLESLNRTEVVSHDDISDWLSENPEVRDLVLTKHPRHHMMHYIQKTHKKMLRRQKKFSEVVKPTRRRRKRVRMKTFSTDCTPLGIADPNPSGTITKIHAEGERQLDRESAFTRYKILSDLENRLISLLPKLSGGS